MRETLFERLVAFIPLPYTVSCILLTLALGFPGYLLSRYIDSRDLAQAFSIIGTVTGSASYWRALIFYWTVAYGAFMFYLFYCVRYFRRQLVRARIELSPLLVGKEEAFDKSFRIVSSRVGALALASVMVLAFVQSIRANIAFSLGGFSAAHAVLSQFILFFAGGTGIWLFFSSVWSLRRLAKESMKLKPSSEDSLFGLGSIGSISLALVLVYFGGLGLRGIGVLASGIETAPVAANVAFEAVLVVSGLVVFLLTINVFHRRMVEQKEVERAALLEERRFLQIDALRAESSDAKNSSSVDRLFLANFLEKRLEKVQTWPFETGALGIISSILVSIVAILLSNVIMVAVHL